MKAPPKKPTTSASHVSLSDSGAPSLHRLRDSVSTSEIGAAIQRCLPDKYDKSKKLIFKLAREWKALCSVDDCPIGVREFVQRWFDLGGRELGESFDVVWLMFLDACDRVRLPKGASPAELALKRAQGNKLPGVALKYEDQRIRRLVAMCRELQVLSGRSPFYLSCRMVGDLLGMSKDTANAILHGLARERVLELIAKGGIHARGKLASRWRFIAPMD